LTATTSQHAVLEIGVFHDLLEVIGQRAWHWLHADATSADFITSDHPVCLFSNVPPKGLLALGYGMTGTTVYFPVSPFLALCGKFDGQTGDYKADAFVVGTFNKRMVNHAHRPLKGVASPQINSLTPVRPIITIDRSDQRFVSSHDVIDGMGVGTNLAAIGWEEFEHLIRELFGKVFSAGGGEVKVTQASRDGGVDAVAFDPDPIRGGKIVIQAKRYTNTVDVSAVRDLYGTVLSEGATKGILVTTSGFEPDAHRFAKGKPLTLLDGNNLLHMLAEHGTIARIDLAEAKKLGNSLMRSSNKV
jgi:hypothetical protein